MTELERWSEDAPVPYARAKRAHAELGPSVEQLSRMLGQIEMTAQAVPGKDARPFHWQLLSALAVGVGLGLGLFLFAARTPPSPPAQTAATDPAVREAAPAPVPRAPAHVDEQARNQIAQPTKTAPVPQVSAHNRSDKVRLKSSMPQTSTQADPAAELTLLSRARRIMLADPARALEITEEHRTQYRHGMLSEERELLAIEALMGLDRRSAAAHRARKFERAFPHSVHAARLGVILKNTAP